MQENPQKMDPDSGLPFCVFHNDRVEHFYCEAHKVNLWLLRLLDAEFVYKSGIQRPIVTCLTCTMSQILKNISIPFRQE